MINKENYNNIGRIAINPTSLGLLAVLSFGAISEDIQDDIISAQIIDSNGKLLLSSDAPIRKFLYHQLYTFKKAGEFGIINDKGEMILEPQFDSYRDGADKVWVEKNGRMVRLNTIIKLE